MQTRHANSAPTVVGYQTIPLQAGYNIFAPTFDGVSKKMDIQDIKLRGVDGEGMDLIWVLDDEGLVTGERYYWLSADNMGCEEEGWTEDGEDLMSREIDAGEGFYLYTDADEAVAVVSGQVKIGPYSKNLQAGYNLTGNFCPVPMDIQNIKLEGVDGEGMDLVWVLDEEGLVTGERYYWLSADNMGCEEEGWTLDGEDLMEKEIQPGEGLYLYTDSDSAKITLPAVLAK